MTILILYTLILSLALAILEIQIEGPNGWAEKLPCWKKKKGIIPEKLIGAPLTSYHLALMGFLIIIAHFPFVFIDWNISVELQIIAVLLLISVIEDFFWFVLNPKFPYKKFREKEIWWHTHWIGPFPAYYWINAFAAIIMLYLSLCP